MTRKSFMFYMNNKKKSSKYIFIFNRIKKIIKFWNEMKVSKWWFFYFSIEVNWPHSLSAFPIVDLVVILRVVLEIHLAKTVISSNNSGKLFSYWLLGSKCSGKIVLTFKQVPLCFNGIVPFMIYGNNSDRHTFPPQRQWLRWWWWSGNHSNIRRNNLIKEWFS